jgi:hypothetical protein
MLAPFLPASKSQAGTTVQLVLELSLLWKNWISHGVGFHF